jgi:transporter family-2 protein
MKALYTFIPYLAMIVAGTLFTAQQTVNAKLRADLASSVWAGFFNYFSGTLVMLTFIILLREPLLSQRAIADSSTSSWLGGMFGAFWIILSILMVPRLGTATAVALIVVGQLGSSLIVDHFGLFGASIHELTATRVIGAAFLVLGTVVIGRS